MNTLRDLLARLAGGGFDTLDALAAELGSSPRELGEMLAKLGELGYIEDAAHGFGAACSEGRTSCAGCRGCGAGFAGPGSGGKVWRLTAKGLEAAGVKE
jgi:hypothetical protein